MIKAPIATRGLIGQSPEIFGHSFCVFPSQFFPGNHPGKAYPFIVGIKPSGKRQHEIFYFDLIKGRQSLPFRAPI
jgi:hypothetical protein